MAKMSKNLTRIIVGVVVLAVVVGVGAYFLFGGSDTKKLTAQFDSAVGVYDGTPVDILGVEVGQVTSVKPGAKYVTVELEYDSKYRVPSNAVVVIVANSLVSDRYLQLSWPEPKASQTIADGATLDADHTQGPAELDDIYSALSRLSVALGPKGANKNGALSEFVKVSEANLKGNGAALGTSITKLSQAITTLSNGREDLFGTVRNLQSVTKALADSDTQVKHFEEQLAQVAGDLASERTDLGAALHNLGGALDKVAGFVKNNQGKLHTDLGGLKVITNILVKDKSALDETLSVAPVALANLVHLYQPNVGAHRHPQQPRLAHRSRKPVPGAEPRRPARSGREAAGVVDQADHRDVHEAAEEPARRQQDHLADRPRPDAAQGADPVVADRQQRARRTDRGRLMRSLRRLRLIGLLVALAVAVSGCGFSGLYGAPLPGGADLGDHPYKVTIYFTNVLDLVPQSTVKVNDVEVGRVEKVALSDRTTTPATSAERLDGQGDHPGQRQRVAAVERPCRGRARPRCSARSTCRSSSRSTRRPTRRSNGSVISLTHTGSAPEVEDVLGALSLLLNGGGLEQIHVITTELNKALQGNESAVRDLLGQLNTFVGTLNGQKDKIFTALDSIDRLTKTLSTNKRIIEQTLDTMPQALQVLKDGGRSSSTCSSACRTSARPPPMSSPRPRRIWWPRSSRCRRCCSS